MSYLEFFFGKYYFWHTTLLYLSRNSSGHHQSFFFNFRISVRKSQSQQKLAKKITHFTIFSTLQIFQQWCFCLVPEKIKPNLLMNSDFLLSNLLSPRESMMKYFSVKHRLQKSEWVLFLIFVTHKYILIVVS